MFDRKRLVGVLLLAALASSAVAAASTTIPKSCKLTPVEGPGASHGYRVVDRASFWAAVDKEVRKPERFTHEGETFYLSKKVLGSRPAGEAPPAARAGIEKIFDVWEKRGSPDRRHLAYALGTAYRETGGRMVPVREAFCVERTADNGKTISADECAVIAVANYMKKHPGRVKENYAIGSPAYYGRGISQITHARNYRCIGYYLGVGEDFVNDPDKVLDPDIGTRILVEGVERGFFSPFRLDLFLNAEKEDWINARKVVNPGSMDHAPITAGYAKIWDRLLKASETPAQAP